MCRAAESNGVAVNIDDLVQPSRQTRHSDPGLSYRPITLAALTNVYKYSFPKYST